MTDNTSEHPSDSSPARYHVKLPYFTDATHARCDHCGKRDIFNNTPLKRCTGCDVVLYCGKDCQRAAWVQHKIFCRTKSDGATTNSHFGHEKLGYTTPLSLVYAVKEWAKTHSYALAAITHIALYTNGGVNHNLAAPHTMLFVLESVADDSDHHGHVSKAFRICNARISHKDDLSFLRSQWTEDRVAKRQRDLALWHEHITNPALAGALPVTFFLRGTSCVLHNAYDVYYPSRHPDNTPSDPLTRLAFNDLNLLCRRAVALGVVFEAPEDTTQNYPKAEMYSQGRRRGWKKIVMPDVWERLLEPMMAQHPSEFHSDLPLECMWGLYVNW